jgi:ankyrin repeat protein
MAKPFFKPSPYFYKPTYADEGVVRQLFNAFQTMNTNDLNAALIGGTDINLFDKSSGGNGLHEVLKNDSKSESEKIEFVRELLKNKIFVNKQDNNYSTPLHIAVSKQYPNIVNLLLDYGAAVDLKDVNGITPIHLAMMRFNKPCLEEKKIDDLTKNPEQKDIVNNQIYKNIINHFIKNLYNKDDLKKMYDFIVNCLEKTIKLDQENKITKKLSQLNNIILKKYTDPSKFEFDSKNRAEINKIIKDAINDIAKDIKQLIHNKLFTSSLEISINDLQDNTSKIDPNPNITFEGKTIDSDLVSKRTIYKEKIGKDLIDHDFGLLDKALLNTFNNIKVESLSLHNTINNFITTGSVSELQKNINDLYLLLGANYSWIDMIKQCLLPNNAKIPTKGICTNNDYNDNNKSLISTELINTIKDKLDAYYLRMMNPFDIDTLANLYKTNMDLLLENNTNGLKTITVNNYNKYGANDINYTTYNNNIQILINTPPLVQNLKEQLEKIIDKKKYKPYYDNDDPNYDLAIKIISYCLRNTKPLTNEYFTYDPVTRKYAERNRNIKFNNITLENDWKKFITDPIYGMISHIKQTSVDIFDKLTFNKNDIPATYNDLIMRTIIQYHHIGRISSIMTHHTRDKIKNNLEDVRNFILKLDPETTLLHDEIKTKIDTIFTKIQKMESEKEKLINQFSEYKKLVSMFINMLNKLNSYNVFKDINDVNNIQFPNNSFTKPIPNFDNTTNLLSIFTSQYPAENDGTIREAFYKYIYPINNYDDLYIHNSTSLNAPVPMPSPIPSPLPNNVTLPKNISIKPDNTNRFFGMFRFFNNFNYPIIPTFNKQNTPNNIPYEIFSGIATDFLNYQKQIYLRELFKLLDNVNGDENIKLFEQINNALLPMKDILNAPGLYLKVIDSVLKENFNEIAYNTALDIIDNNAIKLEFKDFFKKAFEPVKLSLSKLIEDPTNFIIDLGNGEYNYDKNLIEDTSYINKKYFSLKNKTQRLYEINKLNDIEKTCIFNTKDILELLLKKSKGKHNIVDKYGNTPLMYGINGLLTKLIDNDIMRRYFNVSDILNVVNDKGIRPIHQAAINMDSYFKIYYDNDLDKILNNITSKYTDKYHNEIKSIPEFGNNILKSTTNSLNKFAVLLMYYLNERVQTDVDDINGVFNFDYNKLGLTNKNKYGFINYNDLIKSDNPDFYNEKIDNLQKQIATYNEYIGKLDRKINKLKDVYNLGGVTNKTKPPYTIEYKYNNYVQKLAKKQNELGNLQAQLNTLIPLGKGTFNPRLTQNIIREKIVDIMKNKSLTEGLIDIININNSDYSNSFNNYLNNINTNKNRGMLLLHLLHNNYINIVDKLKKEFEKVNRDKKLDKSNFTSIKNDIDNYLPIYKIVEETMRKYEKNKLLEKVQNINDNKFQKDIISLYHAVLLSDLTYPLKDSIIKGISQYNSGTVELVNVPKVNPKGNPSIFNYKQIDEKLTEKMILNKFDTDISTPDIPDNILPEQTFTGILLLHKLNFKSDVNDNNRFAYKDIGELLNDIGNVLPRIVSSRTLENPKYDFNTVLEKNVFVYYKKNYTLLIDGLQHVYNDIMAFYINCGRHMELMKVLLEKIGV